jgi:hypothetical protein
MDWKKIRKVLTLKYVLLALLLIACSIIFAFIIVWVQVVESKDIGIFATAIAVIAQAVFAGLLLRVSLGQKKIMEKQAEISQEQTEILDRQANVNDLIVDLQYMRYLETRRRLERDRIVKLHSPSEGTDPYSVLKNKRTQNSLPTIIEIEAGKELADFHEMLSALDFKFDKHRDRLLSELTNDQKGTVGKMKKEKLEQEIRGIILLLDMKYNAKRRQS